MRGQAEYWKRALAGAPALLELPTDHPRPAQQDHAGAILRVELDEELTAGLKGLSRRRGTTMYMTLLAGWGALLARLSGQEDVVIGTPVANRNQVEIEGLIGFFVNTLAQRVEVSGTPSIGELLERVKREVIAAQQHQEVPFEQVVELVRPVRSLSHSPVFQVMFAWQNAPGGTIDLPGVQVSRLSLAQYAISKFDLTLALQEAGDRIIGGLEYATALFERATVERYLGYFRRLLQAMASDDRQEVGRVDILSEWERRQALYEWNETEVEYPEEKCVHELFEEQVEKSPEAVAVVFENDCLSYGELNRRANRLGHHLRDLGVRPDDRVAICVERSVEMVIGLLAILKSGGAYVPLDPTYPAERLADMLEDSAPVVFLTHGATSTSLDKQLHATTVLNVDSDARQWANQPEHNPAHAGVEQHARSLAYSIYTSGSTGQPKGAMNEHRAVVNRLAWMQQAYELTSDDAVLQKTPFSFDVSVWEFFWPLLFGSRLVVARPEGHKDPSYLASVIQQQKITTMHFVPSMLQSFLEYGGASECHNLKRVVCSGEALPAWLTQRFYDQLPETGLYNLYGPTEAAVDVTAWDCRNSANSVGIPIGSPIANTRIYILNPHGRPSPIGVAGEIYIGGVQVGRGYLSRPTLTAERFLPDPFSGEPGARMYKTGDLGRWLPEGEIEFLGRNDYQVKIRGIRIELGEIQARLLEHGAVREAVVIAREDTPGDKRLVAYYATSEQAEGGVGAEELRKHLLAKLPEYMAPAAYVRLESLPLTPNGKLDRQALPAPEGDAYARRGYEAPQGETETLLAGMWAELLKLERVGRHDNFFELGGHSLLIQQVVNLLAQRGLTILVTDLFEYPTPKLLADRIESCCDRTSSDQAICIRKGGPESPLFLAHEGSGTIFYAHALSQYLDPAIPVYGLPDQSADEPQLQTIEELAMRMVRMIHKIRPRGPYRIAGWSFGGLIAYEIAVQFIGAGEEVEFLGVLDTNYPSLNWKAEADPTFDDKKMLLRGIEPRDHGFMKPGRAEEQRLEFTELTSKSAVLEFDSLLAEAHRTSLLPRQWIGLTAMQVRQILFRFHLFELATLRYSAQYIPIPVHLFLAEENCSTEPFLGWSECLPEGQIRVIPTPGTHQTMMTQPYIEALGQVLSTAICNVSNEMSIR